MFPSVLVCKTVKKNVVLGFRTRDIVPLSQASNQHGQFYCQPDCTASRNKSALCARGSLKCTRPESYHQNGTDHGLVKKRRYESFCTSWINRPHEPSSPESMHIWELFERFSHGLFIISYGVSMNFCWMWALIISVAFLVFVKLNTENHLKKI